MGRWGAVGATAARPDTPFRARLAGRNAGSRERSGARAARFDWAAGRAFPAARGERGEIVWVDELQGEQALPRGDLFAELGLKGALAIPVPAGPPENVLGVAEFYTTAPSPFDDELMGLLIGFTDQLAMFMTRRRAESALRDSEALKSAMLASAYDCVIGMNHLGLVIEFNEAAEETFGYSRDEVMGQELAELLIPPEAA